MGNLPVVPQHSLCPARFPGHLPRLFERTELPLPAGPQGAKLHRRLLSYPFTFPASPPGCFLGHQLIVPRNTSAITDRIKSELEGKDPPAEEEKPAKGSLFSAHPALKSCWVCGHCLRDKQQLRRDSNRGPLCFT